MMRALMAIAVLIGTAGTLPAQVGPGPERLREQVVQRFMENYRMQAGLTDEQYGRLETAMRRTWERRRALQDRERDLFRALEGQLRPGVAANADSVTRLLDGLLQLETERGEQLRRDQQEYAQFLSPVQRAQLVLAFTRLERQIDQIIQRRMEGPGPRRIP